jgi:hypothetical protein
VGRDFGFRPQPLPHPRANAASEAAPSAKLKVVYHLNDLDKASFVLGNIQNHLDGVGAGRRRANRRVAIAGLSSPETLRRCRLT